MKFHEIPVEQLSLRVKSTDSSLDGLFARHTRPVPVANVAASEAENSFDLALADSWVSVTPTTEADAVRLIRELSLGRAMLAQLSGAAPDGSVELQIVFFTGSVVYMGNLEIGVDEYVETGVNRIAKRNVRDVHSWLEERCSFAHLGESYFFITAGAAIEEALSVPDDAAAPQPSTDDAHETAVDVDSEEAPVVEVGIGRHGEPSLKNSFCVTGSDMRFVATTTSLPGGTSIYVAKKLTAHQQASDKTILLAKGRLTFLDWTRTGQIQLQAKAQLAVLTADESSYLKKWDEFGDLEGEILLDTAREFGAIEFSDAEQNRDGTTDVRVIEATDAGFEALANGQLKDLEVVASLPEYITNPDFTFSDFSAGLEASLQTKQDRATHLEVGRYDRQTKKLTLKAEALPPAGTLVMSMAGDVAQIKRRLQARKAILQGRSANPQLGLLVEEKGEITSLRPPQKIKPLTAFVREKVFNNPPTSRQEQAIRVALNTPDIAVIQGPPGTGKTTVIAAILERLNEISARAGVRGQGQVLLSGFQHDAVENMIDRISLNGIPVPKFGKRSGSVVDDLNAFEKNLEEWCGQIAQELRAMNPQIAELEEEAAVNDLYKQYLKTPTHKLATTLVTRIADIDFAILGEKLSRQAVNLKKRLAAQAATGEDPGRHLSAAQRIRTRPESFADDGPERAEDALVDLEDVLEQQQWSLLERAGSWNTDRGIPPFLGDLAQLKRALLVQLTAPPVFKVEKWNDEVLDLADRAISRVKSNGFTAKDKKSAALAGFLAELENNPFGMVDAVSEFSFAFSATVQQSVNKEMQNRKGIAGPMSDDSLEYEYVIVDEAARVSPRDLMIPMSQGKRIILVGDHRQLPHIIDEEVAKRMEEGENDTDENEWLKRSMFQYLFSERLKALEDADGIPRRVNLDKQFRMHPELGSFVSRNFYEAFDRTERFESGLPASAFAHNLPGTDNKPAMWLPVPADRGPAKRLGTSWIRQPEIDEICRQLSGWIESEEGAGLSYGVISFYKAQADRIRSELKRQLGEVADDDRKIRVGTVDSFQGMEFDVVFLSVVRTVPPNWNPRAQEPARQALSLFGHLCLYNRLNVSMSRQQKLLVVVGDPSLVTHELAADFIPGLVDFYRLAGSTKALKAATRQSAGEAEQLAPAVNLEAPIRPAKGALGRLFGRGDG
ncbi:DEAD/DEAH box helicase [Nocardioides sp. Root140]|uniref:DEAD/DEAH box helicase n=1 Tax=Nocardioides sp. Root140 TaxID=1736460 RepID=UPI0009E9D039|nr:AAA domain-containing protein [Nocardioides sp. Root140]